MQEKSAKQQIFLENSLIVTFYFFFILFMFFSCMREDKLPENDLRLSALITDSLLVSDIELFIKKNDSIYIQWKTRGMNVYIENAYIVSFFFCNKMKILTVDQLGFLNRQWIKEAGYLGYIIYKGKFIVFVSDINIDSLVNTDYLGKGIPKEIPDEFSLEALRTNYGGNYHTLTYMINHNNHVELINQNPINFIRKLNQDTNIFPCEDK